MINYGLAWIKSNCKELILSMKNHGIIRKCDDITKKVPNKSGVYFVCKQFKFKEGCLKKCCNVNSCLKRKYTYNNRILYIGSSKNLKNRLNEFRCTLYKSSHSHAGAQTLKSIKKEYINNIYILWHTVDFYKKIKLPKKINKKWKYFEHYELLEHCKKHGSLPFANKTC